MKKRSMLAIASLATGFVVAAITPSHALAGPAPDGAQAPRVGDVHGLADEAGGGGVLSRRAGLPGEATGYTTGGLGLDQGLSPYTS